MSIGQEAAECIMDEEVISNPTAVKQLPSAYPGGLLCSMPRVKGRSRWASWKAA